MFLQTMKRRWVWIHGWHYETITFLRKLEHMKEDTKVIIPTENVYFFIEKIPLDYSVSYADSGQSISKKGASQTLPNVGGIGMYQGEKRWIVMSRMYYWAQAFMKKYPNEMKVYYEDRPVYLLQNSAEYVSSV